MSQRLSRGAVASAFLRSFLIQGSWNYHTMLGSGFAFAVLPCLKELFENDPAQMDAALDRHLEHFNAHPYLAALAVGATLRSESEGTDADTVRRFKTAIRGPLGGIGDSLVWAGWLPVVAMIAITLHWLGAPPWAVVTTFLLLYNTGHLALRVWGFRAGLEFGTRVGPKLSHANFNRWIERLRAIGSVLLGLVVGTMLAASGGVGDAGPLWGALAAGAFLAGLLVGHRVWRPTAVAVVAAVALLSTWSTMR